jgi:hypothetical protein
MANPRKAPRPYRPPKFRMGFSKESWATREAAKKAGQVYLDSLEPRYRTGRSIRVTKDNRPVGGITGGGASAISFSDARYIVRDRKLNPGIRFTYEIWKEK